MRPLVLASIIALSLCLVPVTSSQTKPNQGNYALTTVRLVNTAQSYAHRSGGKYLPLEQLIATGALKQAAETNSDFNSAYTKLNLQKSGAMLEGFELAVIVSSDGTRYELSVNNAKESCGPAYFSDQRGLIYVGKALGCAT